MFEVQNKVALLTGAAGGIGKALSRELLKNGIKGITLVDIDENTGKKLLEEIENTFGPGKAIFIQTDVTKLEDFEIAFKQTVSTFGNIDILINNAGILNEKEWERLIPVNINGVVNGILLGLDKYIPRYKSGSEGVILNTCSIAGVEPFPNIPVYVGSKFAIQGMTRSFGHTYHYERTKVKVLAICPGATESALLRNMCKLSLGEAYKTNLDNETIQSPEFLAEETVTVIKNGKPGSIWVIINAKPAFEYHPARVVYFKE